MLRTSLVASQVLCAKSVPATLKNESARYTLGGSTPRWRPSAMSGYRLTLDFAPETAISCVTDSMAAAHVRYIYREGSGPEVVET